MFSHYALCHLRRNVEPRYKVHAYEAACRCMCIEREKIRQKIRERERGGEVADEESSSEIDATVTE